MAKPVPAEMALSVPLKVIMRLPALLRYKGYPSIVVWFDRCSGPFIRAFIHHTPMNNIHRFILLDFEGKVTEGPGLYIKLARTPILG